MRVGIVGYGNLGRGVELALRDCPDAQAVAVFTRRDPAVLQALTDTRVYAAEDILSLKGKMDILILCGGSSDDLPLMTPALARDFNVVDSFDRHADIPRHRARVEAAARDGGRLALIAAGWDPGLFSVFRTFAAAFFPGGQTCTLWGRGVSQGHSEAIRRIPGVLDAREYTLPTEAAEAAARAGEVPTLPPQELHRRECYVVAAPGADRARIERTIRTMPGYFAGYDTTVTFVEMQELMRDHAALPHGGEVLACGHSGQGGEHTRRMSCRLRLDSNPEFTGSVLVAYARAVCRMREAGRVGCVTVQDVPPGWLLPDGTEEGSLL